VAKRVFISYRREDTAPAAGRVYDRLCHMLKKRNVFFDVSTILGGENFEEKIVVEIARSDTVLAFIGKKWLEPAQDGKPRIWQPGDYVRAELHAALARDIRLLPVLVDGARMPAPDELPEDVRPITTRNALLLRHESFDDDTHNVVAAVLGVSARERPWEAKGRLTAKIATAILGAMALPVILALAHNILMAQALEKSISILMGQSLDSPIGGAATTLLLIVTALLGAGVGWRYPLLRRRRH
jgi:TIR domain